MQHSCPEIKFPGFCINTVWCKVTWANELIAATVTIATSKANCPSAHSVNHQELKQSSRGMSRGEPENIFSIKYSWYCVAWCHKASHTSPGGSSPPTWVTWCKHKQSGHRGEQTETTLRYFQSAEVKYLYKIHLRSRNQQMFYISPLKMTDFLLINQPTVAAWTFCSSYQQYLTIVSYYII